MNFPQQLLTQVVSYGILCSRLNWRRTLSADWTGWRARICEAASVQDIDRPKVIPRIPALYSILIRGCRDTIVFSIKNISLCIHDKHGGECLAKTGSGSFLTKFSPSWVRHTPFCGWNTIYKKLASLRVFLMYINNKLPVTFHWANFVVAYILCFLLAFGMAYFTTK